MIPPVEAPTEYRLQKFLASAGLGSRRQCEEIIRTGRIMVDGEPINNPGINIDPNTQVIELDGERLRPQTPKYFVLNKPKGVLCTNHDPAGRVRVIDLFEKERVRLFPVGRLDEDSEGLLIVTNNGDFSNQLAHPRYRIYRTYRVQVIGNPSPEKIQQLKNGIFFKEGKFKFLHVHRAGKQGKICFSRSDTGRRTQPRSTTLVRADWTQSYFLAANCLRSDQAWQAEARAISSTHSRRTRPTEGDSGTKSFHDEGSSRKPIS